MASSGPAPAKDVTTLPEMTLADVAKHATEKDGWVAVNGVVADVTKYLNEHPGGPDILAEYLGAWRRGGARGGWDSG